MCTQACIRVNKVHILLNLQIHKSHIYKLGQAIHLIYNSLNSDTSSVFFIDVDNLFQILAPW